MRTYGQFCPVAMALEVLAERWTLLVVRELLCGSRRFNDLARGVPLMSRSMLSQRLKTLEDSGVVLRVPSSGGGGHEYHLTQAGQELRPIVMGLGEWGKRWASQELKEEHLDASLLMWDLHRRIKLDLVPPGRILIRFDFTDAPTAQKSYWLRLEEGDADVCYTDPGFEIQAVVRTSVRTLTEVWLGRMQLHHAVRRGELGIAGPGAITRELPRWLGLSTFAEVQMPLST